MYIIASFQVFQPEFPSRLQIYELFGEKTNFSESFSASFFLVE